MDPASLIQIMETVLAQLPPDITKVNKKFWNPTTNEFEDRVFCSARLSKFKDAQAWLLKNYGPSSYDKGIWWLTHDRILVEEKIFTWYLLKRK